MKAFFKKVTSQSTSLFTATMQSATSSAPTEIVLTAEEKEAILLAKEKKSAESNLRREAALIAINEFYSIGRTILRYRVENGGDSSKIALLNFLNDKNEKIEDSLDLKSSPMSPSDLTNLYYDTSKTYIKNLKSVCETPEGIAECVTIGLTDLVIRIVVELPLIALEQFGPDSSMSIINSPRTVVKSLESLAINNLAEIFSLLCKEPKAVEQLRPHLKVLFEVCSQSYPSNLESIRSSLIQILRSIFQNSSSSIIWYVHEQKLITNAVDDLWMLTGENVDSNLTAAFALVPVIAYALVASARHTSAIIDKFKASGGYNFLGKLLENSKQNSLHVNIVLNVIVDLIPIGGEPLKSDSSNISMARNFDAFEVLLRVFTPYIGPLPPPVSSPSSLIKEKSLLVKTAYETEIFLSELIHGIMGLYASHRDNFEILESKYMLLGTLLKCIPYMVTTALPDITIKMIEFVATALDVVPEETLHIFPQLLVSLNCLNKEFNKKHIYVSLKVVDALKTLMTYKSSYKQLLRENGLLDEIFKTLESLYEFSEGGNERNSAALESRDYVATYWCDLLSVMLKDSPENDLAFRDLGGIDLLISLLAQDVSYAGNIRLDVTKVLVSLAVSDLLLGEDIARLLEVFQTSTGKIVTQCGVLSCLSSVMLCNGKIQSIFRMSQGFEAIFGSLASLDGAFIESSFVDEDNSLESEKRKLSQIIVGSINSESSLSLSPRSEKDKNDNGNISLTGGTLSNAMLNPPLIEIVRSTTLDSEQSITLPPATTNSSPEYSPAQLVDDGSDKEITDDEEEDWMNEVSPTHFSAFKSNTMKINNTPALNGAGQPIKRRVSKNNSLPKEEPPKILEIKINSTSPTVNSDNAGSSSISILSVAPPSPDRILEDSIAIEKQIRVTLNSMRKASENAMLFSESTTIVNLWNLLKCLLDTLIASLSFGAVENRDYMSNANRYDMVSTYIKLSGVLSSKRARNVIELLFNLALIPLDESQRNNNVSTSISKQLYNDLVITNPGASKIVIQCVASLQEVDIQKEMLQRLQLAITQGGDQVCESLANTGLVRALLDEFSHVLISSSHPLRRVVLDLVARMGQHYLSPSDIHTFMKLIINGNNTECLQSLVQMAKNSAIQTCFIALPTPKACIVSQGTVSSSWPHANGYSYSAWIRIVAPESSSIIPESWPPINLFSLETSDKKYFTHITIQKGGLIFVQTDTSKDLIPLGSALTCNKWHHVAILHKKGRAKGALAIVKSLNKLKVFIDGERVQTCPLPLMTSCSSGTKVNIQIGGFVDSKENSNETFEWHLGPTLLFETCLKSQMIFSIFLRGVGFRGSFEGSIPVPAPIQCISMRERLFYIVAPSALQSALLSADEANDFVRNTNLLGSVCLKFLAHSSKNEIINLKSGGQLQKTELLLQDSSSNLEVANATLVNGAAIINPIGIVDSLRSIGSIETILPFLGRVSSSSELQLNLQLLALSIHGNESNLDTFSRINGYKIFAFLLHRAFNLNGEICNSEILGEIMSFISFDDGNATVPCGILTNPNLVLHVLLSHEVWRSLDSNLRLKLISSILRLVMPLNPNASFNAMTLNRLDAVPTLLHDLMDLKENLTIEIIHTTIQVVNILMKFLISPSLVNRKELSLLDSLQNADNPPTNDRLIIEKKEKKEEHVRKAFNMVSSIIIATVDEGNVDGIFYQLSSEIRSQLLEMLITITFSIPPEISSATERTGSSIFSPSSIYSSRTDERRFSVDLEDDENSESRSQTFSGESIESAFQAYTKRGSDVAQFAENIDNKRILRIYAAAVDVDLFSLLISRNTDKKTAALSFRLFAAFIQENKLFVKKYLSNASEGDGWNVLTNLPFFSQNNTIYALLFAILLKLPVSEIPSFKEYELSSLADTFSDCNDVTNFDGEDGAKIFDIICKMLINNIKRCKIVDSKEEIKSIIEINATITAFIAYKDMTSPKFNLVLSTKKYISSLVSILFAAAEEQGVENGFYNSSINIIDDFVADAIEEVDDKRSRSKSNSIDITNDSDWKKILLNQTTSSQVKMLKLHVIDNAHLHYNEEVWDWIISAKDKGMFVGDFHGIFADQIMSLLATIMQAAIMSQKKVDKKPEKVVNFVLESFPHYSFPTDCILYQTTCIKVLLPALESVVEELEWNKKDLITNPIPSIFYDVAERVDNNLLVPTLPLLQIILRCINSSLIQNPGGSSELYAGFHNLKASARIISKNILQMSFASPRIEKQTETLTYILEIIKDNILIFVGRIDGENDLVENEDEESGIKFNPEDARLMDNTKDVQTFISSVLNIIFKLILDSNSKISMLSLEILVLIYNLQAPIIKAILSTNVRLPQGIAIATPEQVYQGFGLLKFGPPFSEFLEWFKETVDLILPLIECTCNTISSALEERKIFPLEKVIEIQNASESKQKFKSTETRRLNPLKIKQSQDIEERRFKLVSAHREWRRVSLDHIQEGSRYWTKLCKWHKHDRSPWNEHVSILIGKTSKYGSRPLLTYASENARWKLDKTEGFARMRRRFRLNDKFYNRYGLERKRDDSKSPRKRGSGYVKSEEDGVEDEQFSTLDKIASVVKLKRRPSVVLLNALKDENSISEGASEEVVVEADENDVQNLRIQPLFLSPSVSPSLSPTDRDDLSPKSRLASIDEENFLDKRPSNISTEAVLDHEDSIPKSGRNTALSMWGNHERILALLDEQDRPPISMYNISRVDGLIKYDGILVVCKNALYSIDNFKLTQDNTIVELEEIQEIKFTVGLRSKPWVPLPAGDCIRKGKAQRRSSILDVQSLLSDDNTSTVSHRVRRLAYYHINQYHRRQYLLRPVAIEFFDTDGTNFLFAFNSANEMEEVWNHMTKTDLPSSILEMNSSSKIPTNRWQQWKKSITTKWLSGQLSNFEYLIILNTLAGRSFNDLTQYPVFPWVIADYTSKTLDLTKTETFRDLSKPMGAQSEKRATQFEERYNMLASMPELGEPYHYGTHYTCAGYVLYYLSRLEPYTRMGLQLQGGHFDQPDRLFIDLAASWKSSSEANQQDVRELIPEFYYLPEFLSNFNMFEMGTTQKNHAIHDVILPPWAQNSPLEFVRLHRKALESRYVSEHLHLWIDLIFGFKQRGPNAIEALNIFHPLTYEGAVNIDEIEDPILRASTQTQIQEFGQTPRQIFDTPHPARKVPLLTSTFTSGKGKVISDSTALAWHLPLSPPLVAPPNFESPFHFVPTLQKNVIDTPVTDIVLLDGKLLSVGQNVGKAILHPPNYAKYITCNHADGGIRFCVASLGMIRRELHKTASVHESLHCMPVHCLAVTDDGQRIVTGGLDAVVNVWFYHKEDVNLKKSAHGEKKLRNMGSLCGHVDTVTCIAISRSVGIIVSGSKDCSALLWDLHRLTLIKQLPTRGIVPIVSVSINDQIGNIVVCAGSDMDIFSVNGDLLATVNMTSPNICLFPPSVAISTACSEYVDGVVAVTGHPDGAIALWGMLYPSSTSIEGKLLSKKNFDPTEAAEERENFAIDPSEWSFLTYLNTLHSNSSALNSVDASSSIRCTTGRHLIKLAELREHTSVVTALTLSSDQRDLYSGDKEGKTYKWSVSQDL